MIEEYEICLCAMVYFKKAVLTDSLLLLKLFGEVGKHLRNVLYYDCSLTVKNNGLGKLG